MLAPATEGEEEGEHSLGVVDHEVANKATEDSLNEKRFKYKKYSDNERFKIAKYAILHGSRRAARKFQNQFPLLNESTVRTFVTKYNHLRKMNTKSTIDSVPVKRRGRPVMLGEVVKKVREYIISLRHRGGRISRTVAIATAKAFIQGSNNESVRRMVLGEPWAQSLFRRMGFRRRMATTAKVLIPEKARKEIELVFMHKIVQKVEKHDIPHSLIINADQTPCKYVPTARYTLAEKNSKSVILAGGADKRAITATFAQTLNSEFLPMQLIYQGKTSQSFPKIEFPSGFSLSANKTHFSNTQESIKFLEEIVVPYVKKKRTELDDPNQAALLIWDVF